MPPSLRAMLGLCQRARKLVSGDLAAEQALRRGRADLVLLATDASERTRAKFAHLAAQAGVPCYFVGTRAELGGAVGKAGRAVIVVQSRDFTRGMIGILQREGLAPVTGRG
ncbi:MAG: ribosomal L7Ae/L30e/S12e/Gadd45 family protein [Symbiobacterium sp.]|uniref:L7Ae/L30e/S12e/Gadd45 family ribosomal protein n=1 Tax=Symbiobacterium sp. TaxID=1971213 RepID=UPI003464C335